jgi:hypothetical protein
LRGWTRFKYDAPRIEVDDMREGKVDELTLMKRAAGGNVVELEFLATCDHAPFRAPDARPTSSIAMVIGLAVQFTNLIPSGQAKTHVFRNELSGYRVLRRLEVQVI